MFRSIAAALGRGLFALVVLVPVMAVVVSHALSAGTGVGNRQSLPAPSTDTIGEANPATPRVTIFDQTCQMLTEISRDFTEGATITLRDNQPPDIELGRRVSGSGWPGDRLVGDDTCEAAAARL